MYRFTRKHFVESSLVTVFTRQSVEKLPSEINANNHTHDFLFNVSVDLPGLLFLTEMRNVIKISITVKKETITSIKSYVKRLEN